MEVHPKMMVANELIKQKDIGGSLIDSRYKTTEVVNIGEGTMPNIEPGSDEIPF